MLRLWETIGQALCDTNFRRYRILEGKDEELPEGYALEKLHDRINKFPGRHSMSRFELAEVGRLFSIRKVLSAVIEVCNQWHDYCNKEDIFAATSTEFNRALGLAASDTRWVESVITQKPDDPTEEVHFDLSFEEKKCFRKFLKYAPKGEGSSTTAALLKEIEVNGWSDSCANSVVLSKAYFDIHPKPPYGKGRVVAKGA